MRSSAGHDRGIVAYDVALWLKERYGDEGLKRVSGRLGTQAKAMLGDPKPDEWYPIELMRELYAAVDNELSREDPDALASLGRFMANHGVKGFIKLLVSLISVKTIIWRISALWDYYHEDGTIDVPILREEGNDYEGILSIRDYDAGEAWCRILCGYIQVLVESTGAKEVRVTKQTCIHKGDDHCSWLVNWHE